MKARDNVPTKWSRLIRTSVAAFALVLSAGCDTADQDFEVDELADERGDECPVEGDCTSVDYFHDETNNPQGAHTCEDNCDCTGARTCSQWGWCQGEAGDAGDACVSSDYFYDEANNPQGAHRCEDNCHCTGTRTCSQWGWCQGGPTSTE